MGAERLRSAAFPADGDGAAGIGLNAADDLRHRALAAAGRPEDTRKALRWKTMRHSIQREDFVWLFAEDLHHIVGDDLHNSRSIGGRSPPPSRRDDGAARSWRDRDALDLEQDRRVGKAGHGNG